MSAQAGGGFDPPDEDLMVNHMLEFLDPGKSIIDRFLNLRRTFWPRSGWLSAPLG